MDLLLKSLRWNDRQDDIVADVRIRKGQIIQVGKHLHKTKGEIVREFENHFVYPGLINSHDHLEMNLYPRLGDPYYQNYTQWANDIYKPGESPIREIEKLNIKDRLLWGGIKNLISGVTTVVHHNPWHRFLESRQFPVKVLKKMAWSHSLAFGKKIEKNFPSNKDVPFIVHAGEGVDDFAEAEIFKLDDLRLLRKNTVLIHAIAIREEQIRRIIERKSSIIWCPSSNLYMFGKTAPIDKIKNQIPIALGSDSTLTGSPTLLHEMSAAHATGLATSHEILAMVTSIPSKIFSLPDPKIAPGQPADLFIAKTNSNNYFENLISLIPGDIQMVIVNGAIKLSELKDVKELKYQFKVENSIRFTDIDLKALMEKIYRKVGNQLNANALWKLLS
jgi:cytosine/adenosine deaminase-related metal-dependent hydrolase